MNLGIVEYGYYWIHLPTYLRNKKLHTASVRVKINIGKYNMPETIKKSNNDESNSIYSLVFA